MFYIVHPMFAALSDWWKFDGSLGGDILLAGLVAAVVAAWKYHHAMVKLERKAEVVAGEIEKRLADRAPDKPRDP